MHYVFILCHCNSTELFCTIFYQRIKENNKWVSDEAATENLNLQVYEFSDNSKYVICSVMSTVFVVIKNGTGNTDRRLFLTYLILSLLRVPNVKLSLIFQNYKLGKIEK